MTIGPNYSSKFVGAAPVDRTGQLPLMWPKMSYQNDIEVLRANLAGECLVCRRESPNLHRSWSTEVIFPDRRPPRSVGRDPDVLLKGATGSQDHLYSSSSSNRDSTDSGFNQNLHSLPFFLLIVTSTDFWILLTSSLPFFTSS